MSKSKTIYEKIFGGSQSATEAAANAAIGKDLQTQGASFLTRAISFFHLKEDLDEAYVKDKGAIQTFKSTPNTLLLGAGTAFVLSTLFTPFALATAVTLLEVALFPAIVVATGGLFAYSAIKEAQQNKKVKSLEETIDQRYGTISRDLEEDIRGMQLSLEKQAPDVRQQFNDAFNASLTKRGLLDQRVAAEKNAAALAKSSGSSGAGTGFAAGAVTGAVVSRTMN